MRTPQAEQAYQMCRVVMAARDYSRIGQITGEPGTGKSALTNWLSDEFGAVRIECWAGMNDKRTDGAPVGTKSDHDRL